MSDRIMIDCEGVNAVAVHELQPNIVIAGCYVTGTQNVLWSESEKELWAEHAVLVTIDQGFQSPAITTAVVRDVEVEAWSPEKAVDLSTWDKSVERPTLYTDLDNLPGILTAGWKNDLWLTIPGWVPGDTLPEHGSCTVVAVQNTENVNNLYDSSEVLDAFWPNRKPVTVSTENQSGWLWCAKCQGLFYGPGIKESACPRGGTHEDKGSGTYTLSVEVTS